MVKKFSILFVLISSIAYNNLNGQTNATIEYEELITGAVSEDGENLLSPFCGGINSTQPNHVDLNMDGLNDIVLYDQNTRTLKTFINVGAAGEEKYMYDPKFAKNFPQIDFYLKLIDYNCDNIPDLFHKGGAGISVSTGYYNINNELSFTYYQDLYYPGTFGPINAYVQPNDIPIIADVDGDGDLDFVSFDVLGSYAPWYKNLQVENNLPCDSIRIIDGDPCFGKMYQTFYRTHVLNASCKGSSGSNKQQRHGGNCILAIDMNNDGLLDMLGGNSNYTDAQILYNGGTLANPLFTSQDTAFSAGGHQIEMFSWAAPFYFDIDNDNDKDLVFTPHNDNSNTANFNVMAVYENTGTTANPNLVWRNDSAFTNLMVDVGRNSYPTLYDYDKDGKLDLFIGGESYFNTALQTNVSQLAHYKNTSTLGVVSFELVTKDFLNLSSQNYRGLYPNFGDITGDGVDDLILGNDSGTIAVYNNLAASNSVTPNFTFQTDSLPGIDVGNFSYPFIYDLNADGKTDLLIGCEIGTIYLYEDTSATSVKELKRIDSAIGGIKAAGDYTFFGYGAPYIGSVDSSTKDYLLLGNADGTIQRIDSFTNQYTNWVEVDSNMAKIQTAYRSAPAIADLDGDLRPELLVGNQNGGLHLYRFVKNNANVNVSTIYRDRVEIKLFPNPANNELYIQASDNSKLISEYRILDISGRTIIHNKKVQKLTEQISISSLTSGLYFIEISFGDHLYAKGKFMKKN